MDDRRTEVHGSPLFRQKVTRRLGRLETIVFLNSCASFELQYINSLHRDPGFYTRLAMLRQAALVAPRLIPATQGSAAQGVLTALRAGQAAAVEASASGSRTIVSVPVKGNNLDAAWKGINRKIRENDLLKAWKRQVVYTKPTEMRKEARAATAARLERRHFNAKLRWIFKRTGG